MQAKDLKEKNSELENLNSERISQDSLQSMVMMREKLRMILGQQEEALREVKYFPKTKNKSPKTLNKVRFKVKYQ